jgi:hypothetical protein
MKSECRWGSCDDYFPQPGLYPALMANWWRGLQLLLENSPLNDPAIAEAHMRAI